MPSVHRDRLATALARHARAFAADLCVRDFVLGATAFAGDSHGRFGARAMERASGHDRLKPRICPLQEGEFRSLSRLLYGLQNAETAAEAPSPVKRGVGAGLRRAMCPEKTRVAAPVSGSSGGVVPSPSAGVPFCPCGPRAHCQRRSCGQERDGSRSLLQAAASFFGRCGPVAVRARTRCE